MVKVLTEDNFIEMYGDKGYDAILRMMIQKMTDDESFNGGDKIIYAMAVLRDPTGLMLHLEAHMDRRTDGFEIIQFNQIVLTDEVDYSLDRYNLIKNKYGH